jgi:hypothetical protein
MNMCMNPVKNWYIVRLYRFVLRNMRNDFKQMLSCYHDGTFSWVLRNRNMFLQLRLRVKNKIRFRVLLKIPVSVYSTSQMFLRNEIKNTVNLGQMATILLYHLKQIYMWRSIGPGVGCPFFAWIFFLASMQNGCKTQPVSHDFRFSWRNT